VGGEGGSNPGGDLAGAGGDQTGAGAAAVEAAAGAGGGASGGPAGWRPWRWWRRIRRRRRPVEVVVAAVEAGAAQAGAGPRRDAAGGRAQLDGNEQRAGVWQTGRRNPRMMYTGNLNINERNSLLNAESYSISGASIPKPYSNNTTVNATLGGAIQNPQALGRDEGQFTLSFGVTRGRNASTGQLTTMPTDLEKTGNFSQSITSAGKGVYDLRSADEHTVSE